MDRRLPVYLVVDCSHSMRGAPIAAVRSGIERMANDLRSDPFAIETVWLSVIAFATGAEQVVPLTDVLQFTAPELVAKGQTHMGAALRLLAERIDQEVRLSTPEQKGDWKPIAFLLSDGGPGDAWVKPADEVRARHEAGQMLMVAVGFGPDVHVDKLKRVTPQVVLFESSEPEAFARFLQWASTSVSRSCQAVATGRGPALDWPSLPSNASAVRFEP